MDQDEQFEHRFWLQILGDHARFIYNALSPNEHSDIMKANQFIKLFDTLLERARAQPIEQLNEDANQAVMQIKEFELNLLERSLLNEVSIGLTPTFLNHMVNELEEYERILTALLSEKPVPIFHSLHHDLLWLPDAAGHASAIAMDLDSTEKKLIKKSKEFEKHFNEFYLKAIEITGYLRTLKQQYPALVKFHEDVNLEMVVFMKLLKEVEELELSAELLSRINPLIPDHMQREECYYLLKLSQTGGTPPPECDPTRPRKM